MTTTTSRERRDPTSAPSLPVRALVAAGTSPQGRATIDGELIWIPLPCRRVDCSCRADFAGVVTRGITDVARVQTLIGVSRTSIRRAITAGMCPDCVPPSKASSEAERLLRVADGLPDGALVRRDRAGRIVPVRPDPTLQPNGDTTAPGSAR